MATTSEADAREVMRRYFHGVNNEDWDDFAQIWHDDAVVDVTGGLHFEGVGQVLPYYPMVLKNFPVHYDDPYAIHVAGDVVTVEIEFRGETLEGVKAGWEAVDVFTLRDGKIAKLTTWYDMGHVVNLLRTPGVPEKRLAVLVGLAAAKSPFYKARLSELGLTATDVVAEIAKLPPTTEAELAGNPVAFVAAPQKEIRQLHLSRTGAVLSLTRGDIEDAAWVLSRALEQAGVTGEDVLLAAEPIPGLAEAALRLRVRLAVAPTPEAAAPLGVTFVLGADAFVATPETGVVAAPCSAGAFHAFTDAHHVEIVDEQLLVTPLGRKGMPLLRYATGHRAAWVEGACTCGSELPRLSIES